MQPQRKEQPEVGHRERPEIGKPVMAKADLRFAEKREFRAEIGQCVERARHQMGWNLDQLAQACGGDRDPRQVARWCAGSERPQFDVLLAIPFFGEELLIELARMRGARIIRRVEFGDQVLVRE